MSRNANPRYVLVVQDGAGGLPVVHGPYKTRERARAEAERVRVALLRDGHTLGGADDLAGYVVPIQPGPVNIGDTLARFA